MTRTLSILLNSNQVTLLSLKACLKSSWNPAPRATEWLSSYLVSVTWVRVLNHVTIPQSSQLHPLNEPFVSF
jgi:hypothetical protein